MQYKESFENIARWPYTWCSPLRLFFNTPVSLWSQSPHQGSKSRHVCLQKGRRAGLLLWEGMETGLGPDRRSWVALSAMLSCAARQYNTRCAPPGKPLCPSLLHSTDFSWHPLASGSHHGTDPPAWLLLWTVVSYTDIFMVALQKFPPKNKTYWNLAKLTESYIRVHGRNYALHF